MTFEEWNDNHWKVTEWIGGQYALEAPDCKYIFNKHDLLELYHNIREVAEPLYNSALQSFADRNGIHINDIEKAFRRCWNGNGKLITENRQLRAENKALKDIESICEKYNIKLEDVAETLEEYICLDNGEEL